MWGGGQGSREAVSDPHTGSSLKVKVLGFSVFGGDRDPGVIIYIYNKDSN